MGEDPTNNLQRELHGLGRNRLVGSSAYTRPKPLAGKKWSREEEDDKVFDKTKRERGDDKAGSPQFGGFSVTAGLTGCSTGTEVSCSS